MFVKMQITLVTLLLIITTTTIGHPTAKFRKVVSLYSNEDVVEELTFDNFHEKVIYRASTPWFIKFYLSWCGHCQKLAVIWKQFARDIFGWKDLVQIGAMDCADERNTEICRGQKMVQYPVLKYLPINRHGINVDIPLADENVKSIRHYLLERIMTEIKEGRGGKYPNILPYLHSGLDKIFDDVSHDVKYVFLVVERPGQYLGAEVAMDLHKTPNIAIKYTFNNNTDLIKNQPSNETPMVIATDNKEETFLGVLSSRQDIKERIVKFLQEKGMEVVEEKAPDKKLQIENSSNSEAEAEKVLKQYMKLMGDVVFQKDLETALRYSLKQEVAISEVIDKEPLKALSDYLKLIKEYFPFGYKSPVFLTELDQITNLTSLEGDKLAKMVKKAVENGVFSSEYGFLGCQGSEFKFRGYTCSLWQLFHYLTVNSDHDKNPDDVLKIIYGYIKYFFSCKDCSNHFQEMASRRNLTQVSSVNDSILWLWRAHNEVNERLKGTSTEDPKFPKVQFPTKNACPRCVNEDSSFNEAEVLIYLKKMYGRGQVRYLGADTRVLFEALSWF